MMQTSQEDKGDVLTVGYREFYDAPSETWWRNARTGLYEGKSGLYGAVEVDGAVEVKIVPFAELYSSKFISVPGGNGCEQVYEVSENSWVRCSKTGVRGIARNSEIRIIKDDLENLIL